MTSINLTDPKLSINLDGKDIITDINEAEDLSVYDKFEYSFPSLSNSDGEMNFDLSGFKNPIDKIFCIIPKHESAVAFDSNGVATTSEYYPTALLNITYADLGFYSARTLLNELIIDYNAHIALASAHPVPDTVNTTETDIVITLTECLTAVNALKTAYNAHNTDAVLAVPTYHAAQGTDYPITSADATTIATFITLVNEIKTQYELHRVDAVAHTAADTTNIITSANAADPGSQIIPYRVSKNSILSFDTVFSDFITTLGVSTDEENGFELLLKAYSLTN